MSLYLFERGEKSVFLLILNGERMPVVPHKSPSGETLFQIMGLRALQWRIQDEFPRANATF